MILDKNIQELLGRLWDMPRQNEVTGFLLEYPRHEQRFVAVRNISTNRYSFFITDDQVRAVKKYAEKSGAVVEAFVHSHERTTEMSDNDETSFKTSEFNWIIFARVDGVLKKSFYGCCGGS